MTSKYEIKIGSLSTYARNGLELDSYVAEALSWGTDPASIVITLVVEKEPTNETV
jgi:hypothetical protein